MNTHHILFIAQRLFRYKSPHKGVSASAVHIATAGVAVGLAVMIISVCVVLGFKEEVRSKVVGFGSHVQVMNYESLSSFESKPIAVNDDLINLVEGEENVAHWQRFCDKAGMLKTDSAFLGVVLHGVGPEYDTTFLHRNLVAGRIPQFSDEKSTNKVVLSEKMAADLHLKVGDKVYAYFFDNSVRARRFTVEGIYSSHMSEFDQRILFADIYTSNRLNGWQQDQYSGIELQLHDYQKLKPTAMSLARKINVRLGTDTYGKAYATMSIEDLYPQIFAWLELLNTNVWVILILMTGIAAFTMISGLLIIILERTNFIGIMKALGAPSASIRSIFLWLACFIVGRGLLWGNIIGVGLMLIQKYCGLFRLDAATYYIDRVPVLFDWTYIVVINLATLFISVVVLLLPSILISRIDPVKSIRFE